jgi:mono/diheme cytochrome c family protein
MLPLFALVLSSSLLRPALAGEEPPRGATLYASSCTTCHGAKADGKGPAAIAMRPRPTDFTQAAWWKDRTDATVAASIRAGKPGTAMGAFPQISEGDALAIASWLRARAPSPTP